MQTGEVGSCQLSAGGGHLLPPARELLDARVKPGHGILGRMAYYCDNAVGGIATA